MRFLISGNTDIGNTKSTNQDSLSLKVMNTPQGRMAIAVICDGLGGLEKGEVASASVIRAFDEWTRTRLPEFCNAPLEDHVIRNEWDSIVQNQNRKIQAYGARLGIKLGTTVTAMLLTQKRYYVMNVGDSRAYELYNGIRQITTDQTLVQREVSMGLITEEQALTDERRNMLLQCVGASEEVYTDMFFGETQRNAVYMLCCDGFRHEITPEEIYQYLQPDVIFDEASMNRNSRYLIDLNKQRRERDNISVGLIRTF